MPTRERAPLAVSSASALAGSAAGTAADSRCQALTGAADPNGPIFKEGAFRRDPFQPAPDGGELGASPVILSKARWLSERAQLLATATPIGLYLEAGAGLDDIAPDLPRFALIALNFPKFSDGRPFSTARLVREKFGFREELRAVGHVLTDQIAFMRRVGFDAFEVSHAPTRHALSTGALAEVSLYYQPIGAAGETGRRTWLRAGAG